MVKLIFQCTQKLALRHLFKYLTVFYDKTPAHNAKVGGSKSSQHLLGRAADIQVASTSVEDVAAYAESLLHNWGGVGRYPVKAGRAKGWVHVDTRPNKSRWTM